MKLPDAKCTSHGKKGTVTDVHSCNNLSIDVIPRHVVDIRRVIHPSEDEDSREERSEGEEIDHGGDQDEVQDVAALRRLQRERQQAIWMRDYETGSDFPLE